MSLPDDVKVYVKMVVGLHMDYIQKNEEQLELAKIGLDTLAAWDTEAPPGKVAIANVEGVGEKLSHKELLGHVSGLIQMNTITKWSQKFYTYIHNKDKTKALKYHDKLNEKWLEQNEKLAEQDRDPKRKIELEIATHNGVDVVSGDEAYRQHSKEMKKKYDDRVLMLSYLN